MPWQVLIFLLIARGTRLGMSLERICRQVDKLLPTTLLAGKVFSLFQLSYDFLRRAFCFLLYFAFCFNHLIKSAQNIIKSKFPFGSPSQLRAFVYAKELESRGFERAVEKKPRKRGPENRKMGGNGENALAEDGNAHQQLSRICSKLLDYENMLRLLLNLSGCRKLSTHPSGPPPCPLSLNRAANLLA